MSELGIKPENYYLDVLQNPDYYLTGEKPIYKKIIKEAYSREQVLKLLESQLAIPKSIVDMIDKEIMADAVTKFAMFHEGFERLWLSDELEMYCANKENYALASAYLAGKALGVDLVKVVEG
ncbi:hypothetical protein [Lactococcus lactis]|uniref:hypothetical protein n=1 Tax=Lactococcus lactis TaxID=1358 RepID=UPI000BF8DADE|nr:hypothetical protein [Lactococcus lactis]PFG86670.1 hypothetical protein BW153_04665 [Lactococcus lactis]